MILGKVFSPLKGAAPLLLRLMVGSVFLYHGGDKVGLIGPDGFSESIRTAIGAAKHAGFHPAEFFGYVLAFTEFLGGILMVLGFATRYAAVALGFVMAVAVFKVHGPNGFSILNRGYEYPLTLLVANLSLLLTGPGPLAVDRLFAPKG